VLSVATGAVPPQAARIGTMSAANSTPAKFFFQRSKFMKCLFLI
jgi:hypothetical protein